MSQQDLAHAADCTEQTISRLERGLTVPRLKTLKRIAEAVGGDFEEVQRLVNDGAKADQSMSQTPDSFDNNVEPYSIRQVPNIPLFDLAVAAGGWVEITGEAEVCDPMQMDHGLFRIRIRGDSMDPEYKDGEVIEFRCLRPDRDGLEQGVDYYLQRSDGTATFKRLERMDEDTLWLRPLNREKYPRLIEVPRGLIVRAARAIAHVKLIGGV